MGSVRRPFNSQGQWPPTAQALGWDHREPRKRGREHSSTGHQMTLGMEGQRGRAQGRCQVGLGPDQAELRSLSRIDREGTATMPTSSRPGQPASGDQATNWSSQGRDHKAALRAFTFSFLSQVENNLYETFFKTQKKMNAEMKIILSLVRIFECLFVHLPPFI